MRFISIQEAMKKGSGKVSLRGWCYRERGSNKMHFIVLRDHSNIIQCVVDSESPAFEEARKVTLESSIEVHGKIRKDRRAPTGYELQVSLLKIIGRSDTFPITKDQSNEFLLDKRHLWLRSRKLTSVMKVRATVFRAFREFFQRQGYYELPPPIFTPSACEGGSTLFEVKYFNDTVYLTQSWQLYAEAAIFALEKIYCISPCFRAERSKTSRHLAEFWMAEMEAAWMGLDELTEIGKELVAFIVKRVVRDNAAELRILGQDITKLKSMTLPYPTITYTEALRILKDKESVDIPWGKDLRTIEEDKLMKHFSKPIVVTHYPRATMAFYKPADPKDPKLALCFAMLAPEGYGELIGGSQRDTDINSLIERLKHEGEDISKYEWYLDLRRYGSVPHAGL
jgi:asparaginyl-tRNA synthetase